MCLFYNIPILSGFFFKSGAQFLIFNSIIDSIPEMSADIKLEKLQQELYWLSIRMNLLLKYKKIILNIAIRLPHALFIAHIMYNWINIGLGCISVKPYVYFPFDILPGIPVNLAWWMALNGHVLGWIGVSKSYIELILKLTLRALEIMFTIFSNLRPYSKKNS